MSKKVFRNFEEFVSLTRPLNLSQRKKLLETLPKSERKAFIMSWQSDGWEDLFIRNEVDDVIDLIRQEFGEDLILLRIQVRSGTIRKVRKAFWNKVCSLLEPYPEKHTSYVIEGVEVEELGDEWVLLVPSKKRG